MFPYLRVKGAVEKFRLTEPGATGLVIHLHCDNCDEPAARAVAAGAVMVREPSDAFYGERSCTIRDPFGHEWMLGHEIEKVEPEFSARIATVAKPEFRSTDILIETETQMLRISVKTKQSREWPSVSGLYRAEDFLVLVDMQGKTEQKPETNEIWK